MTRDEGGSKFYKLMNVQMCKWKSKYKSDGNLDYQSFWYLDPSDGPLTGYDMRTSAWVSISDNNRDTLNPNI